MSIKGDRALAAIKKGCSISVDGSDTIPDELAKLVRAAIAAGTRITVRSAMGLTSERYKALLGIAEDNPGLVTIVL